MSEYSKRAEKLAEVYVTWMQSTDKDAGWRQPGDFDGTIPADEYCPNPSSYMISQIRWITNPHALLPLAIDMMEKLLPKHRIPLIAHHRDTGTVNPETGRVWTEAAIARGLHLRLDQYRHRRRHAKAKIAQWLQEQEEARQEQRQKGEAA